MKPPCRQTHGLLLAGTCPWCDCPVVDGQPRPELPAREAATRRWNRPAMLQALQHTNTDLRMMVVTNLHLHETKVDEALSVLREALNNPREEVRWLARTALRMLGSNLMAGDAQRYERVSNDEPDDTALHLLLLGYYFLPATRDQTARRARHRHVLWVIEHAPELVTDGGADIDLNPSEDGEAYQQAKRLWLQQTEARKDNTTVLGNAARFFAPHEPAIGESLLERACGLEPDNPERREQLGRLRRCQARQLAGEARREAAGRSLADFEAALERTPDKLHRYFLLPDVAKAALEARENEKARAYATELLKLSPRFTDPSCPDGSAVHYGHLVLGRLALQAGDVEVAKGHLLASAKMMGSPALCTGGPNMSLAKELLDRDEREVVVEYLRLCSTFWETNDHRAEQWIYAIERGVIPDFGAKLWY